MSDLEGKQIRSYELGDAVGSGGFGTVYHAIQDVIKREVAVKVIREKYANQPQFIRRFETEARIIARLEHPHIVPLYDYWRDLEGAYLIMRWLRGGSLRDRMKRRRFEPAEIITFLNQIASALSLAHSRDIIHRDIKPENILLDEQGNAYLTDFGIAVDLVGTDADERIVSAENMSYGSPEYVAPEQLIEKVVSPQSDVYSLGIMLYEMLANARPFSGASTEEIVKMQVRNPVPSLKLSRPDLPPEIDTVIWQATAKKPAARYENVMALALAFQQVAGDITNVPPQYRVVARRRNLSTGEGDLRTGKVDESSLGTSNLGTGKMISEERNTDNINLVTSELADVDADFYDTADLAGTDVGRYDTADLSGVDVSPGRYDTADLSNVDVDDARYSTDSLGDIDVGSGQYDTANLDDVDAGGEQYDTSDLSDEGVDQERYDTADLSGVDVGQQGRYDTADLSHIDLSATDGAGDSDAAVDKPTSEVYFSLGTMELGGHKGPNPYKGLSAFQESDAGNFYGREGIVESLVNSFRDGEKRFLALVGASGSGKSSLVRAGVIPAMRKGELDGSEDWYITTMVPGPDPFESLSEVLLSVAVHAPQNWGEQLRQRVDGLHNLLNSIMPEDDAELVLFIDQFEEVFTLTESEEVRQHFLSAIYYALVTANSRLRVIVTLRADYYDRPLNYSEFGELVRENNEIVLPLTEREMELAIRLPIENNYGLIADNLVSAILEEVRYQPGAMPLVQYALTQMYDLAHDNTLNYALYDEIGGVSGALAQSADKIFDQLPAHKQAITRQLFMRMVVLGEDGRATRRRILWSDLVSGIPDREAADEVIDTFAKSRLLTLDNDPKTRAPTVDIAHEALIEKWEQFEDWIDQNRADLQRRQQLSHAVIEWATHDRIKDYLALGTRLAEFESLLSSQTLVLGEDERDYLEASIAYREQTERRERFVTNVLRGFGVVSSVLAVIALIAFFFARSESQRANENLIAAQAAEDEAVTNFEAAQSRALAANAIANLADTDLALLMSIEAVQIDNTYEAFSSLLTTVQTPFLDTYLYGHTNGVRAVAYSADGTLIASAGADKTIRLWDVETRQPLGDPLEGHEQAINDIAFSPDGQFLASASEDGTIRIWTTDDWTFVTSLDSYNSSVRAIDFSSDGDFLVGVAGDLNTGGQFIVWDMASAAIEYELSESHAGIIYAVAYSPDGTLIATGGDDNMVRLWDAETGELVGELERHTNWVLTLAFTPDGTTLISGGAESVLNYWDVANQSWLGTLITQHDDWIRDIAISADGQFLVSASQDNTVKLWSIQGRPIETLAGHDDGVWAVDFHPDTLQIITGSSDRQIGIWQIAFPQNPGIVETSTGLTISGFAARDDGQQYMLADTRGTFLVLDTETNQAAFNLTRNAVVTTSAFSSDGSLLAVAGEQANITVYDVDADEVLAEFEGHDLLISSLIFTADNAQLISGDQGGKIMRWDLETFESIETQLERVDSDGITVMAISHAGQYLAVGARDTTIVVWDLTTEEIVATLTGHEDAIDALVFDRSDTRLISGGRDADIIIWDFLADETLLRTLTGHESFIADLAISPNNQYLASASRDASVRLWDLETSRQVGLPLAGHQQAAMGVDFRSDDTLISIGANGDIIRWDLNVERLIDLACEMSNRSLTVREWGQFIQIGEYHETCDV